MSSPNCDCPICMTDLGPNNKAYDLTHTEKEISDSAYRLLCGHAFHYSCIFLYQRHDSVQGCPICKNFVASEAPPLAPTQVQSPETNFSSFDIITFDLDGNVLSYQSAEDQDAPDPIQEEIELGTLRRAGDLLSQAGRNKGVQQARRNLNESLKEYRVLETELKVERAKLVRATLKSFTAKFQPKFQSSFKDLKKKLKALKDKEVSVVNTLDSTFDFTRDNAGTYANYSIRDVLDTSFGPLKRSFWK